MRATISSCGRPGEEVKAICGLLARPVTLMPTSTSSMSLVATRSICGLGGRLAGEGDMAAGRAGSGGRRGRRCRGSARPRRRSRASRSCPGRAGRALPFGFEAHAGDEDAVVGVEADVEPPDARHAGVGRFCARRSAAARRGGGRRRAAAPRRRPGGRSGSGPRRGRASPEIEAPLRLLTMARLPVAVAPISSLRASRAFWNLSRRSIGKPAAEARPIVPRAVDRAVAGAAGERDDLELRAGEAAVDGEIGDPRPVGLVDDR